MSVDIHVHQIAEEDVILGDSVTAAIPFIVVDDNVGVQCPSEGLDEVNITSIVCGVSVTVYDDISTVSRPEDGHTVSWERDSERGRSSTCRSL